MGKNTTTYISILRGINVSGQKKIKMEELKKLYESLGVQHVRTYIQSGNVIFESQNEDTVKHENNIKDAIKESFGFDVPILIKRKDEIENVIQNNPFADKDLSSVHVTFLSDFPDTLPLDDINHIKDVSEEFLIKGKEIYLYCPNGYGKSRLINNLFERKLKVSATTRNWKTVNALFEIAK